MPLRLYWYLESHNIKKIGFSAYFGQNQCLETRRALYFQNKFREKFFLYQFKETNTVVSQDRSRRGETTDIYDQTYRHRLQMIILYK